MGTDQRHCMHEVVDQAVQRRYLDKPTNGAALDNSTADFARFKAFRRRRSRNVVKGGFPALMPV
jgi:hypothetical protein